MENVKTADEWRRNEDRLLISRMVGADLRFSLVLFIPLLLVIWSVPWFCQSYHTEAPGATRGAAGQEKAENNWTPRLRAGGGALCRPAYFISLFFDETLSCFYHRDLFLKSRISILLNYWSRQCKACEQATKEGCDWLFPVWLNSEILPKCFCASGRLPVSYVCRL